MRVLSSVQANDEHAEGGATTLVYFGQVPIPRRNFQPDEYDEKRNDKISLDIYDEIFENSDCGDAHCPNRKVGSVGSGDRIRHGNGKVGVKNEKPTATLLGTSINCRCFFFLDFCIKV